jgi:GNAT superfamily N-acetyltransferase
MGEVTEIAQWLGCELTPPGPIKLTHDVKHFCCGKPPLDDWLRQRAIKAEGKTARTYVVCRSNSVVGYYALVTGAVKRDKLPKKLTRNTPDHIPILTLARLAVDSRTKKTGIGSGLLKDALSRVIQVSSIVGVRALLVHAKDDEAMAFYERFGFAEFPIGTQTLFLPIETIVTAI